MDTIEQVEKKLMSRELLNNPHECAELRSVLSGNYSFIVGQLEEIKARKPIVWLEMRNNFKSDSATDKAYEATESGLAETALRGQLKRIEKMISGLGSLIKVAEGDIYNTH